LNAAALTLTDTQLLRYSRHILLEEVGIDGQRALLSAHLLVVGAGGLGCAAGLYLGSAGVGQLTVVDHDVVEATNLQRQIAHTLARIGQPKAASLSEAIAQINPDVTVHAVNQRADADLLCQLVATADVVLDCTDNFASRHAINRACFAASKPLVSGAAIRLDGQLSVYDPRLHTSPCYACVFPEASGVEEAHCATMGVFAPLVGIVGSMQAAEALKLASGMGSTMVGRLLMLDGRRMEWTDIRLPRQRNCPVCSGRAT
jgi:molybdopterin-synthase adenylyltransferase